MTAVLGVSAIATALPEEVIDNLSQAAELGFQEGFLRDKIGFLSLHRATGDTRCRDMARGALQNLLARTGMAATDIDCLFVCTQNPDGHGLPNTASALHGEMGLAQNCAALDISLGCSGYVYGLSIIQSFMQANGMRRGVLITADPYSRIVDPTDRDTAALFGDGATATLLTPGGPWRLGRSLFGSDGTRRDAIAVGDDGRLSMNGRGVFVFAAQTIPPLVERTLAANDLAMDEIDLVLVHQGSRYIVDELRKRLRLDEARLPFLAGPIGNTVSSSLPFMLADRLDGPERRILLAGFGVGLSWGASILSRQDEQTRITEMKND